MNSLSLQIKPHLRTRFSDYLAEYLHAGLKVLRLVGLWQQFQQSNMSVLRVLLGLQPRTATARPLRSQPRSGSRSRLKLMPPGRE